MGKPSNSQTAQAQGASAALIVDPRAGQDELRATSSIKSSAKIESSSTLTASLTSRPASPSFESPRHDLLTASNDDERASDDVTGTLFYQVPTLSTPKLPRTSGLQQASAQSCIDDIDEDVDEDGDVFYDALEEFEGEVVATPMPAKHQRAVGIQQAPLNPEFEGRSKGRTTVRSSRATARPTATYAPSVSAAAPTWNRGSSSSVAAPPIFSSPPLFAPPAPVLEGPTKRALLIGVNYNNSQELKLQHANRDAVELGRVLANVCQFPEENLLFVTDESRASSNLPGAFGPVRSQVAAASDLNIPQIGDSRWEGYVHREGKKRFVEPTRRNVLEGCRWLTHGAKAGDELVMHFSGHCRSYRGQTYLVTTAAGGGQSQIFKEDLRRELISKIPKGCRLTIVLDCCHSAAMVNLQYCIGNMRPKEENSDPETPEVTVVAATEPNETACLEDKPATDPNRSLQTSLYGVRPGIVTQEPEPVIVNEEPTPPGGFAAEPFAPPAPVPRPSKRPGGVVAAPAPTSVPVPTRTTTASSWLPTWITGAPTAAEPAPPSTVEVRPPAVTSAGVRRTRNCVVEAVRPSDHFEERKAGFDRPEGDVAVWAAAGADQSAFEASGVRHGIVTGALCKALETCPGITLRDLWGCLRADIHSENELRHERDQAKKESKRPDPKDRTQHAELWVSQIEDLECTSRALDRSFCSGVVTGPRHRPAPSPAAQACSEGVPDCPTPIAV